MALTNQKLTSLFVLGHPCPKREALNKSSGPMAFQIASQRLLMQFAIQGGVNYF